MHSNCIFIIGMHRSGTSAIARVINLLGVELGSNLYPPQPHNPLGLWEHTGIMQIHEKLFDFFGNPWFYSIGPFTDKWWDNVEVEKLRHELIRIIKKDFDHLPLWGLKDPRMSRFLPLWQTIFEELLCKPHFIHIIRNPLEVSASLKKRNNLPQNMSMLLWLQHILESEIQTRNYSRVFVTFNQLLNNCHGTMKRVEDTLGINWPVKFEAVAGDINTFLSPELKHHNVADDNNTDQNSNLPGLIKDVYNFCIKASQHTDSDPINSLTDVFNSWKDGIQTEPAQMLIEDLKKMIPELGSLIYKLAQSEERLTKVLNSRSWRITAPLRSNLVLKIYHSLRRCF